MNPSQSGPVPESELVTCTNCGMSWTTRVSCGLCMFRSGGVDPNCEQCGGSRKASPEPANSE